MGICRLGWKGLRSILFFSYMFYFSLVLTRKCIASFYLERGKMGRSGLSRGTCLLCEQGERLVRLFGVTERPAQGTPVYASSHQGHLP